MATKQRQAKYNRIKQARKVARIKELIAQPNRSSGQVQSAPGHVDTAALAEAAARADFLAAERADDEATAAAAADLAEAAAEAVERDAAPATALLAEVASVEAAAVTKQRNEAEEAAFAAAETPITPWLENNRVKVKPDLSAELEELEVVYATDLLALTATEIGSLQAMMRSVSKTNFDKALAALRAAAPG